MTACCGQRQRTISFGCPECDFDIPGPPASVRGKQIPFLSRSSGGSCNFHMKNSDFRPEIMIFATRFFFSVRSGGQPNHNAIWTASGQSWSPHGTDSGREWISAFFAPYPAGKIAPNPRGKLKLGHAPSTYHRSYPCPTPCQISWPTDHSL